MGLKVLGTAAAMALALAAGSAAAQDVPSLADAPDVSMEEQIAELRTMVPQLMNQLNELGETMGIEALPPVDWDRFLTAFAAAMPTLPEDDERSWASGVNFRFDTHNETNPSEDDEPAPAIVGEASGCMAGVDTRGQPAEVLHFRRIRTEDVTGHHCVVGIQGEEDGAWVLASTTVARGHGRRLVSTYNMAVVVESDLAQSRAMAEPKIEAQVAVAASIADYAMGLLDRAPAATPTTP